MDSESAVSRRHPLLDATAAAVGMIPSVGPALAPFADRLAQPLVEEWQRNTSTALRAAERVSGMTREDLAEQLAQDRRLLPLVTRVLYQAGMTGSDKKLEALGAVLGCAMDQREQLDAAEMLLASLDRISGTHITVLELIGGEPPPDDSASEPRTGWSENDVCTQTALEPDSARIALLGLEQAGLVSGQLLYNGGHLYQPTHLGAVLLETLRQHSLESGQE